MPEVIIHKLKGSGKIAKFVTIIVKIKNEKDSKNSNIHLDSAYVDNTKNLSILYEEDKDLHRALSLNVAHAEDNHWRENEYEIHVFPIDKKNVNKTDQQSIKEFIGDFLLNQNNYTEQIKIGEISKPSGEENLIRQQKVFLDAFIQSLPAKLQGFASSPFPGSFLLPNIVLREKKTDSSPKKISEAMRTSTLVNSTQRRISFMWKPKVSSSMVPEGCEIEKQVASPSSPGRRDNCP